MPTLELIEDVALYAPNEGGQQGFMDDYTHRYVALAGGWFAGKTWAGARKLIDLHIFNAFDDEGSPTGIASCVIAQTYQLAETINIPEMRKALDEAGIKFRFVADKTRYWFELPQLGTSRMPSLIYVRTADAPDKISGFSVGAIWGDEVARWKSDDADPLRDPLLQAKGRLRGVGPRFKQFIMTFTHEGDMTRMYRDFEEDPKPEHFLYRAGTVENPHAKEFGESILTQLSPDLAEQYVGGKAASLRGNAMYPQFNKEIHASDSAIELRDDLPLQFSIDFNFNPGMHGILGQYDEVADLFTAVYLIHKTHMTVPQMIHEMKDLIEKECGGWRWPGRLQVFGDENGGRPHSAERGETKWDVVAEYLKVNGFDFQFRKHSNNPFISDRVNAVNAALMDARGQVHYRIHPRCARLVDDLRGMKWTNEGETDKKDDQRSHASEAEGYRIQYLRPVRKIRRAPMYGGSAA